MLRNVTRNNLGAVITLSVALLAALLLVLTAKPAHAAHPGSNGIIVFTSNRDGDKEIYTMPYAGGSVTQVTNNTHNDRMPSVGPGGERIAFVSHRDGNDEIYLADEDGSNVVRLTNNAAKDEQPTWSNNGAEVAFTRTPTGEDSEIYSLAAAAPEGSTDTAGNTVAPFQLTDNAADDERPSYSPDGDLAFDREVVGVTGQDRIVVMTDTSTQAETVIQPEGTQTATFNVTASADDKSAIFYDSDSYPPSETLYGDDASSNLSIERSTYNGTNYQISNGLVRIDTSAIPDNATVTGATFKAQPTAVADANSRTLTADYYNWNGTNSDYSENAQTGALSGTAVSSISTGAVRSFPLDNVAANINKSGNTSLRFHISGGQPTGENAVLFATYDHATLPEPQLVVEYTTSNGGEVDPDWSPDGSKIVYEKGPSQSADIKAMNPDGTGRTVIANTSDAEQRPQYSPDGTAVLYERNVSGTNTEVYKQVLSSGTTTNMTSNSAEDEFPEVRPLPAEDTLTAITDESLEDDGSGVNATFTFGKSPSFDPATSYQCQMDGGGWSSCTSPKTYTGLTLDVEHTFEVKGTLNGVTDTPVSEPFTVSDNTSGELGFITARVVTGSVSWLLSQVGINVWSPGVATHEHNDDGAGPFATISYAGANYDTGQLRAGAKIDSIVNTCDGTLLGSYVKTYGYNFETNTVHNAVVTGGFNHCNNTYTRANHEYHQTGRGGGVWGGVSNHPR